MTGRKYHKPVKLTYETRKSSILLAQYNCSKTRKEVKTWKKTLSLTVEYGARTLRVHFFDGKLFL